MALGVHSLARVVGPTGVHSIDGVGSLVRRSLALRGPFTKSGGDVRLAWLIATTGRTSVKPRRTTAARTATSNTPGSWIATARTARPGRSAVTPRTSASWPRPPAAARAAADAVPWLADTDVDAAHGFARALGETRTVAELRRQVPRGLAQLVPADVLTSHVTHLCSEMNETRRITPGGAGGPGRRGRR